MSTSEKHPVCSVVVFYLKMYSKQSYQGFLDLCQAEKLDKSSFNDLKERVIKEWSRYAKELESYWRGVITEQNKLELINKIAELQRLLKKSTYEFDVIVNLKRIKAFKWIANIDQVNLEDLRESIYAMYQTLELEKDELNDERSQVIIKHLMTDLNFRLKAIPIGNEASKSQYIYAYLVAVTNLFGNKFKVCPEKNVSGPNGHGPVDFALVLVRTSRIIGIAEGKPKFKLSKLMVIVYGDEDMEDRVKNVLSDIVWLLEEAQRLNGPEAYNILRHIVGVPGIILGLMITQ
ncbi:1637_t:CDS:2 [Funneliformis geosporum]|uniref:1637_t:CDS:1 n=1 Tax=Funneliformis geosporum TaxID=1117311 RepID=A0A9W4SWL3_9GLOM|nr:1637_t:CDS:2 [Funneliformis geosporum]